MQHYTVDIDGGRHVSSGHPTRESAMQWLVRKRLTNVPWIIRNGKGAIVAGFDGAAIAKANDKAESIK